MLTADLLRVVKRKGRLYPQYLDAADAQARAKAAELVELFERHRDRPKGEIDAAVEEAIGHGTDFLVWRGLAKLLYDRSTFETVADADPGQVRRTVFELAAGVAVTKERRAAIFAEAAETLGICPEACEAALYADLEARQPMVEHKGLEADALLHRYNLALAQAALYRAVAMDVELRAPDPNRLRYLFQTLKFHRLMHSVHRHGDAYRLRIDGPASLFKMSRKYGLKMATFLPALLLAKDWSMTAKVDWEGDGKLLDFELSPEQGLVSHYRARGQWVAEEERWFEERFAQLDSGWELERRGSVLELRDGEVLVPDYVLTSPDGEEVFVEIVGFWRFDYLERRIAMLDEVDEPLVLVVGERMKTDRKKLAEAPPQVFFFKGVILADKVLEAAEAALKSGR